LFKERAEERGRIFIAFLGASEDKADSMIGNDYYEHHKIITNRYHLVDEEQVFKFYSAAISAFHRGCNEYKTKNIEVIALDPSTNRNSQDKGYSERINGSMKNHIEEVRGYSSLISTIHDTEDHKKILNKLSSKPHKGFESSRFCASRGPNIKLISSFRSTDYEGITDINNWSFDCKVENMVWSDMGARLLSQYIFHKALMNLR